MPRRYRGSSVIMQRKARPFTPMITANITSEYVNGQAHTNGIESFWALLKRGYHGTYHHMSPKHLDRYVGEFAGRHNDRSSNTIDQMVHIVRPGASGPKM